MQHLFFGQSLPSFIPGLLCAFFFFLPTPSVTVCVSSKFPFFPLVNNMSVSVAVCVVLLFPCWSHRILDFCIFFSILGRVRVSWCILFHSLCVYFIYLCFCVCWRFEFSLISSEFNFGFFFLQDLLKKSSFLTFFFYRLSLFLITIIFY